MRIADKICRRTDLKSGVQRESLGRLFGTGENMGHVFAIEVLDGGRDVNLTGAEVTAYFIKPNNSTVTIAGDTYCSTAGNVCTVALPEECYTVTGRFTFTVCLTLDGVMHAVYSASGYVSRSSTDQIDDNTVTVTLGELKDRIDALNDSIPQDYGDMTRYIHAVCEAHTVSEFTDPVPAPLAKVQEEKVSGTKVRLSGQTSAPEGFTA